MSCIMLSNDHYNEVFTTLARCHNRATYGKECNSAYYIGKKILQIFPESFDNPAWLNFLQEKLIRHNLTAYNLRYKKKEKFLKNEYFVQYRNWNSHTVSEAELVRCFKLLQAIDYQCIDSNRYYRSKLRKQVKELTGYIAETIVSQSEEYRAEKWVI